MASVTLVMAAGPGFPQGSPDHRYELAAKLTPGGQLDAVAWAADPAPWAAQRLWPGAPPRAGDLLHDEETGWSLRFFPGPGEAMDAPLHAAIQEPGQLRPGEYVTIREPDGPEYAWRVVSVR
jgi:hypothetical protein